VIQLRQLVTLADSRAESPAESWTRLVMHDRGLPPPQPQFAILEAGRERYRLDLAYPFHRVCIEFDGKAFHDSPQQRAADAKRRDWLRQHGWIVIVITKDDFSSSRIDAWVALVWDALRSR